MKNSLMLILAIAPMASQLYGLVPMSGSLTGICATYANNQKTITSCSTLNTNCSNGTLPSTDLFLHTSAGSSTENMGLYICKNNAWNIVQPHDPECNNKFFYINQGMSCWLAACASKNPGAKAQCTSAPPSLSSLLGPNIIQFNNLFYSCAC